jgi:hypothetical protein
MREGVTGGFNSTETHAGRGARHRDARQLLALCEEGKGRGVGADLGVPHREEEEGGSDRRDMAVGAVGAGAGSDTGVEEAVASRAWRCRLSRRRGRCMGRLVGGPRGTVKGAVVNLIQTQISIGFELYSNLFKI